MRISEYHATADDDPADIAYHRSETWIGNRRDEALDSWCNRMWQTQPRAGSAGVRWPIGPLLRTPVTLKICAVIDSVYADSSAALYMAEAAEEKHQRQSSLLANIQSHPALAEAFVGGLDALFAFAGISENEARALELSLDHDADGNPLSYFQIATAMSTTKRIVDNKFVRDALNRAREKFRIAVLDGAAA